MKILIDIDNTEAMDLKYECQAIRGLLAHFGHKSPTTTVLSIGDSSAIQMLIDKSITNAGDINVSLSEYWNNLSMLFNLK